LIDERGSRTRFRPPLRRCASCLSSVGREQEIPTGGPANSARRRTLYKLHQRLYALFLVDDLRAQRGLELQRVRAALIGIERKNEFRPWPLLALPQLRRTQIQRARRQKSKLRQLDLKRGLPGVRNCKSNPAPLRGDSEIRRIGGNRSASSMFNSRSSPTSFCTAANWNPPNRSGCCCSLFRATHAN